jgi:hypothetical protein
VMPYDDMVSEGSFNTAPLCINFKDEMGSDVWDDKVASSVERGVSEGEGMGMLNLRKRSASVYA